MDASITLGNLLTGTDLEKGLGYINKDTKLSAREKHLLEWGKTKIGADTLFVQYPTMNGSCFPLIYFRRLEDPDPANMAEIHKLAWNMGQAPLLFIVLPGKIRVYSTYEKPKKKKETGQFDEQAGLVDIIDFSSKIESLRQKLAKYRREELLSGRFWELNKERFKPDFRVQKTLLDNLATIRDLLLINNKNLSSRMVNRLLGRSIFIQYLQDRKDSNNRNVFPQSFFDAYKSGAISFTDVLMDKEGTYRLFKFLEEKFNGDIFPVETKEEKIVEQQDLKCLADFLRGDIQLQKKQLALWPYYSFDVIPIEFISNLYEEFFHFERQISTPEAGRKKKFKAGTYYTPHRLVDFLMDEVFPWDGENKDFRILDPACGSGIFLVEAYRRLISRWQQGNPEKRLSAPVLKSLLTKNIYGVDSNPEAILIAAFSLYLTLCDYLEPRYIWNSVSFPFLRDSNLWVRDFFDFVETPPNELQKVDLVIGNPPWESKISPAAAKYIKNHSRPIGDKQIAQTFLWAAPDVCKESGEIVLIAPSKGLLFNTSRPNRAFREKFFSTFEVKTIINFSAFRRSLFPKAVGPASPIFYRPVPPKTPRQILYCCPKPSYSPEDNWHYVIEPQDIARIPVDQAVANQNIWKAAMWGTPRDWELINKLATLPKLRDVSKDQGWIDGEGFIVGANEDKKEEAAWLTNKSYVTPGTLSPLYIEEKKLPKLKEKRFYRSGKTIRRIFEGPHLLITQSPRVLQGFIAALLRDYAVFPQSIIGIWAPKSDETILGALSVVVNSVIPVYFAMLTSERWLVERDELTKNEIMSLPVPLSISTGEFGISYNELKRIANQDNVSFAESLQKSSSIYGLTNNEISLIRDTIEYTLEYFHRKESSKAMKNPSKTMLLAYGVSFCRVLNESFGLSKDGFSATIFTNNMPMILARISYNRKVGSTVTKIEGASGRLTETIKRIDQVLLDKGSGGIYIRRNLRIYDGMDIYLIKRNQSRYWTKTAAFRDADESYADIMRSWKG